MNKRPTAQDIANSCNAKISYLREHYFSRKAEIAMDMIGSGLAPNTILDEYMVHCDTVVSLLLDQLSLVSELACSLAYENEALGVDTALGNMESIFKDISDTSEDEQLDIFYDDDIEDEEKDYDNDATD